MMKIVTYNLRWDAPEDGVHRFSIRKEEVMARIKEEMPDVIAFQEMRADMQMWMEPRMAEYFFVGHGRDADFNGESIPIAFRKDKFKMRAFECFWISPTPEIPGSRYAEQGRSLRICNVLTLYSVEEKKSFRIYNVHLDHASAVARSKGIQLVVDYAKMMNEKENLPTVILGDLNAFPEWDDLNPITKNPDYVDVTKDIPVTFHGFFVAADKIDYIFMSKQWNSKECYIWENREDRPCLSDHYPVCVLAEMENE